MKDSVKKHLTLFTSTLKLSACTFGGGFVIIPLLRKKFVDQFHWINEQEMLDLIAIAQSAPGAIAVNISILVGYHIIGVTGALISVLGTIIPPLVIVSVISFFYQAFRDNTYINFAMQGMLAGVAVVVCDVVVNMVIGIIKKKRILPVAILATAFIATYFFNVNIIAIILCCGALGATDVLYQAQKQKKTGGNV